MAQINSQTSLTSTAKSSFWQRMMAIREMGLLLIIILLMIVLSLASPHFLTASNITTTLIGLATDGIIAVGMTIALVSGGFDLSVGSVLALSGVATGALYIGGMNIWLATILGLVISVGCGMVNGYFIGKIGINPMITTLSMMNIARGAAYVLTEGSPLSLAQTPKAFTNLGGGTALGIPVIVLIFIVIAVIGDYMMRHSAFIRQVFYVGSNSKAASLSGINVSKVKFLVFIIVAVLSGIAGILTLSRFNVATPSAGLGTEMRVMSAAIIGGASLSGGEGTVFGAVLGVILLALVNDGLVLLAVSVYWQDLISGIILLAAVTLDYINHTRRRTA
ncbi:ABC transporter permease [Mahella australiensis]|uniref:Monosaccharide ABC transporter membrane protein, CUT2 family n=1 Tax=Mahella australiensis (strain DSM 15567 / CIP 107919 / 50-1 BON) TaxID=697281 RepID=F3ZVW9_MAHA5|nr:ABC transporter permease [Mahella australiensis]AEE95343.1 monosaccharide ABC transporter membrane protein, CUT2 family [Mahella australiensis 50-1 BON]